jgi:phage gp37-like protein
MPLTIVEIEDALVARIQGEVPGLALVETYAGQVEDDLRHLAYRFPAVLIALQARKREPDLEEFGQVYGFNYVFDLLVCCRNLRGEAAGRREAGGIYQILDGLQTALMGQTLGLAILPLEFQGEEAVMIAKDLVVYKATYSLAYQGNFEEE